MRKFAIVAIMIALLPVSAFAEDYKGPATARTYSENKNDEAIDKAYQDTMKRMDPNGKSAKSDDPWQTIRPAPGDNTKH